MAWVIDRFEGDRAVLEDMETLEAISVTRGVLPPPARERDVVMLNSVGGYEINAAETAKRKERAAGLLERLKKRYH